MRARLLPAITAILTLGAFTPAAAHAQPKPAASAESDAKEKSRAAFRKGVAQLRASDWPAARASFETAYALFPHPSILLNLAIARLRTDDPVRAEQDLVKFLSEDGGASADELASAREALGDARGRLGTLRIVVSPASARVTVDERAVETVRRADPGTAGVVAELRIKPGSHTVAVEAEGFVPDRRPVVVAARTEAMVTVELASTEPAPLPPSSVAPRETSVRTVVGWSLVGLAGAALVTGGVTALRAKSLSDDYGDASNARYQDPAARSEGIGFRTAADVALGVAVLSGAAAVVLLLTDVGKDAPPASSSTGRWRLGLAGGGRDLVLRW
ncbi:MAG: TonB-dependent receptor [Labilithrix sp.]|nr:TonB-dependent receptor [Labilithrix sp.]